MYAVVYKERVIVGPMDWNRGLYQGSLEDKGVNTLLPRVAPEDSELPLVINEDARIMKVEEVRPSLNPMVEYYYGPLWDVSGTTAVATYEVHDSPIDAARVNFKNQAAEERWKKEVKGTKINIEGTEVSVDTTREGRLNYAQKLSTLPDGATINWKFSEGWLTLTKAQLTAVTSAANAYVQTCFDWEKTINDQIDAATTKEELVAIEIVTPSAPL